MIARFFVDRPIFATVISIVIVLAGVVAWTALPVAMTPVPPVQPVNRLPPEVPV